MPHEHITRPSKACSTARRCIGFALSVVAYAAAHGQTLPAPPVSPTPVSNYEYDAEGNPTKTVVAPATRAYATQHEYDSLSRRKKITDAKSGTIQFGYDLQDQLTSVTDPRSLSTQYQPTGLGDVKQIISPDSGTATSTYDAAGNLLTRTDARGVLATYDYDELNRPKQVVYSKAGQASRTVSWTYDQTGASYGYGVGRLTTASTPDASTTFRYDALGRVTMAIQSGAVGNPLVVNTGYDDAGHVTSLTYPSGRVVNFGWANGQPQSVSVTSGTTTTTLLDQIAMSAFGPVKSWVWQFGGTPKAHDRVFDTSGRLVRHPLGNMVRDITYDDADRISRYTHYTAATAAAATAYDQSFGYDELNRLTTVTGSTNWSYAYDANGNRTAATARAYSVQATSNRLDALTTPARSMGYDAAGNTSSDTQSGSSSNYTGTYSLEGRLAQMNQGNYGVAFGYDALGRRVSRQQLGTTAGQVITGTGGSAVIVGTAGDDIIEGGVGAQTLTGNGGRDQFVYRSMFDAGDIITDFKSGIDSLVFTGLFASLGISTTTPLSAGFVTCLQQSDGAVIGVDADGPTGSFRSRAVLKLKGVNCSAVNDSIWGDGVYVGTGITSYAFDQDNHLIGEYNADGTPITEYVWLGDIPVAVIKPDGTGFKIYAIHTDHLDTPRVILDASGQVRWRWMGEPFGSSPAEEQPTVGLTALQQNLRFPGQQYEAFGGRHYNHFRDYDPTTGRYVQSDPIGLGGGINTYSYAGGNPLSGIDSDGLATIVGAPAYGPNFGKPSKEYQEWQKRFGEPLRRMLDEVQDRIRGLCQMDRSRLQREFDEWLVTADPYIDNPVKRIQEAYGVTKGNKTTFSRRFFLTEFNEKPSQLYQGWHEFRHTMPGNASIVDPSGGFGNILAGRPERVPSEIDADAFADWLINRSNSCGCPK
jgi:RHS repeat-associated protein